MSVGRQRRRGLKEPRILRANPGAGATLVATLGVLRREVLGPGVELDSSLELRAGAAERRSHLLAREAAVEQESHLPVTLVRVGQCPGTEATAPERRGGLRPAGIARIDRTRNEAGGDSA